MSKLGVAVMIFLVMTLPITVIYLSIDVLIEYKEAINNCQSNGWDTAGHTGRVLDKNFQCYNYTKAERDALVATGEGEKNG